MSFFSKLFSKKPDGEAEEGAAEEAAADAAAPADASTKPSRRAPEATASSPAREAPKPPKAQAPVVPRAEAKVDVTRADKPAAPAPAPSVPRAAAAKPAADPPRADAKPEPARPASKGKTLPMQNASAPSAAASATSSTARRSSRPPPGGRTPSHRPGVSATATSGRAPSVMPRAVAPSFGDLPPAVAVVQHGAAAAAAATAAPAPAAAKAPASGAIATGAAARNAPSAVMRRDAQHDRETVPDPGAIERLLDGFADDEDGKAFVKRLESGAMATVKASQGPDARELFGEMAIGHAGPVRDFVLDVQGGRARAEWVVLCEPVLDGLRTGAQQLEMAELTKALEGFAAALRRVDKKRKGFLTEDEQRAVTTAYAPLVTAMPKVFALDEEQGRRSAAMYQGLVLQAPGASLSTLERLAGAGVGTLNALLLVTDPNELAVVSGLPKSLAEAIVEVVQAFRTDVLEQPPDAARTVERTYLAALVHEMERQQEEFEAADAGWSKEAAATKKRLRTEREVTFLKAKVLLARLGEVARLEVMERTSFDRRIRALREYLAEAATAAAAATKSRKA